MKIVFILFVSSYLFLSFNLLSINAYSLRQFFSYANPTKGSIEPELAQFNPSLNLKSLTLTKTELLNVHGIIRNKGDCLTSDEQEKLVKSVDYVDKFLTSAAFSLKVFGNIQDDEKVKRYLGEAAEIVRKVNVDLVSNLTRIAEEACGSCDDIAHAVDDAVSVIFATVTDIDDELKTNPIYDAVLTAAKAVVVITEDVCKARREDLYPELKYLIPDGMEVNDWHYGENKKECLTKEQKDDIDEVIELAGNVLNTFAQWIKESEAKVESEELKKVLEEISKLLLQEKKELHDRGEQMIENLCEACSKSTHIAFRIISIEEKLLSIVFPIWRHVPPLKKLDEEIQKLLTKAKTMCPYEYTNQHLFEFEKDVLVQDDYFMLSVAANGAMSDFRGNHNLRMYKRLSPFKNEQVTCKEVVNDIANGIAAIEAEMDEMLPEWRKTFVLREFDRMIHEVIEEALKRCPNEGSKLFAFVDRTLMFKVLPYIHEPNIPRRDMFHAGDCLSDDQKKAVSKQVAWFKAQVDGFKNGLNNLERGLDDTELGPIIKQLISKITELEDKVSVAYENQMEGSCENCYELVSAVEAGKEQIVQFLNLHVPTWKDMPLFAGLIEGVERFNTLLRSMCKIAPPNELELQVKTCLTPSEERDVKNVVSAVDKVLNSAIELCNELAKVVDSTSFKEYLEQLKTTLLKERNFVDHESLVDAEAACKMCSAYGKNFKEEVAMIEETLNDYIPTWKNVPQLVSLQQEIDLILKDWNALCPFEVSPLALESCNSGLSSDVFAKVVEATQIFVQDASLPVDREFSDDIAVISRDLNQPCISCSEIVNQLESYVEAVEKYLSQNFPEWQQLPFLPQLNNALHYILDQIQSKCPSARFSLSLKRSFLFSKSAEMLYHAGCLPADEKEKLYNISTHLEVGLEFASKMIKMYSEFEPNPVTRYSLEEASKVIDVISKDIVENITTLADEFCGDCSDLTIATRDSVLVLEKALFDIEPMWKDTPIYSAVVVVTNDVFEKIEELCKHSTVILVESSKKSCLTPEEDDSLKYYSGKLQELFDYGADMLKMYAEELPDEYEKEQLLFAANVLHVLADDIVANVTKIADEACGSCSDLLKVLKDAELMVEKAMTDVDKDWRSNEKYKEVLMAVNAFISIVESLCPQNIGYKVSPDSLALSNFENFAFEQLIVVVGSLQLILQSFNDLSPFQVQMTIFLDEMKSALVSKNVGTVISASYNFKSATKKTISNIPIELLFFKSEISTACNFDDPNVEFVATAINHFFALANEIVQSSTTKSRDVENAQDVTSSAVSYLYEMEQDLKERELCGKCDDVVKAFSDVLLGVENIIRRIEPNVEKYGIYRAIVDAANAFLKMLHDLCPQTIAEEALPLLINKVMFRGVFE